MARLPFGTLVCQPLKPALQHKLHSCDINVLSWNPTVQYLVATGADDGTFASWDLRNWMSSTSETELNPLTKFDWHKAPITSIDGTPLMHQSLPSLLQMIN